MAALVAGRARDDLNPLYLNDAQRWDDKYTMLADYHEEMIHQGIQRKRATRYLETEAARKESRDGEDEITTIHPMDALDRTRVVTIMEEAKRECYAREMERHSRPLK